ncbi:response regulator transcription factor [Pantoea sp. JGM49]|jgi:FixJ family two-component response regulator|uniref:Response regulator transcription factor n=2 Tax=Pantoea TaxID=53335 RepID=A0ABX0RLT6_9GAMM|nr:MULTISPECIES: response regulator [Pantoea]HAU5564381.1 response regulator transcription factor [Serratia fonticola]KJV44870.1 LuxR family transcriptional regulator [Pantoea sp. BL1]MBS0881436.1 response regulator transcription factor [Pantoea sp. JGM49]MDI9278748.1 LuxR C-terminal-related transcriptional regulator [Pantoea sp. EABMAA-21]MXP54929.1 response regulator transcription factor [Pantoea sp. Seng]
MSAKVWLVDDDLSVRESLGFLLRTLEYDVADFADLASFEAATSAQEPLRGCLLLDVRMPGISGLSWLAEKGERHPLLPVIIMTGHGTIEACRRAFRQGAFEFYTKPLEIEPLLESVHQAMHESEQRAQRWQAQQILQSRFALLSVRENEVMQLMIAGQTSKEIARDLSLSPRTVEAHRAAVLTKLEMDNLAQLIHAWQQLNQV